MKSQAFLSLLMAVLLIDLSATFNIYDLVEAEWEEFKAKHGKKYENEIVEKFRKKIYLENRHRIAKHNNAEQPFKLGMNSFGDLLPHEFVKTMNGFRQDLQNKTKHTMLRASFMAPENIQLPKSIDWREKGYVTPVKNQGQCGSCWSFSTTGALEGQNFRKTGKLVSLSEQNLIDCSSAEGNQGCNGGLMDNAFEYIKINHGIDTEVRYPYEGRDDDCRFKKRFIGAKDIGYMDIESGSERKLKQAVGTVGPVSVAIDASHETFQFYESGVYFDRKCSSTELDHGVLVVGYGTEDGEDYWLVKNSWGEDWGDGGYIKMARNRHNNCGIATQASYPIV